MQKILLQQSQSILYEKCLSILSEHFEVIVAPDDALGKALIENKSLITGVVIFELSERSLKLCELVRDKRFNDPSVPVAYVGFECSKYPLPFGARRFDVANLDSLLNYIRKQFKIDALVVEDDDALREITTLTLSKTMNVEKAANGNDALVVLQARCFDLVVLDVMLPGMSGAELFKYIREHSPLTAVVMITAFDTDERQLDFSLEGAAAYIRKPFESNKIFRQQVVDAVIAHHAQNESKRLAKVKGEQHRLLDGHIERMSRYC